MAAYYIPNMDNQDPWQSYLALPANNNQNFNYLADLEQAPPTDINLPRENTSPVNYNSIPVPQDTSFPCYQSGFNTLSLGPLQQYATGPYTPEGNYSVSLTPSPQYSSGPYSAECAYSSSRAPSRLQPTATDYPTSSDYSFFGMAPSRVFSTGTDYSTENNYSFFGTPSRVLATGIDYSSGSAFPAVSRTPFHLLSAATECSTSSNFGRSSRAPYCSMSSAPDYSTVSDFSDISGTSPLYYTTGAYASGSNTITSHAPSTLATGSCQSDSYLRDGLDTGYPPDFFASIGNPSVGVDTLGKTSTKRSTRVIKTPYARPVQPSGHAALNKRVSNRLNFKEYKQLTPGLQSTLLTVVCGMRDCGVLCFGKEALEEHLKTTHKLKEIHNNSYSCPACDKSILGGHAFDEHVKTTHGLPKAAYRASDKLPCPWDGCRKKFKKSSLYRHVTTHSNITFCCPICPSIRCSRIREFKIHFKGHHPEEFKGGLYRYIEAIKHPRRSS